jgi:hypothetical protein
MLFPRVVPAVGIVGKRGIDAALGGDRMGPYGMDLGKKGYIVFLAKTDGCPQTCKASSDYEHIVRDRHHETIK